MNFIVELLILLPARIASYFSWAGPLIMRLIVGYVFMLSGWGKLNNQPQIIFESICSCRRWNDVELRFPFW